MENNKKSGFANLMKKTAAIFGASFTALTGIQTTIALPSQLDNLDDKRIQVKEINKVKPMPVLKLNMHNPENSQFVASHRSHSSHRSHYSHYSHRSGAMFA
jgi:hypothetical protein